MNRFKLILKGIMLWITAFMSALFIVGIDSIYDNGYILQTFTVVALMIFCCYKLISEEEFEILSLYRWFKRIIEESCEQ